MGIAILSGVVDSLEARNNTIRPPHPKWEVHTPGTMTPAESSEDPSIPSRFIACVTRTESAKRLQSVFSALGPLGTAVEVVTGQNLESVRQADAVLLWFAHYSLAIMLELPLT